jgi:hypothetical protein
MNSRLEELSEDMLGQYPDPSMGEWRQKSGNGCTMVLHPHDSPFRGAMQDGAFLRADGHATPFDATLSAVVKHFQHAKGTAMVDSVALEPSGGVPSACARVESAFEGGCLHTQLPTVPPQQAVCPARAGAPCRRSSRLQWVPPCGYHCQGMLGGAATKQSCIEVLDDAVLLRPVTLSGLAGHTSTSSDTHAQKLCHRFPAQRTHRCDLLNVPVSISMNDEMALQRCNESQRSAHFDQSMCPLHGIDIAICRCLPGTIRTNSSKTTQRSQNLHTSDQSEAISGNFQAANGASNSPVAGLHLSGMQAGACVKCCNLSGTICKDKMDTHAPVDDSPSPKANQSHTSSCVGDVQGDTLSSGGMCLVSPFVTSGTSEGRASVSCREYDINDGARNPYAWQQAGSAAGNVQVACIDYSDNFGDPGCVEQIDGPADQNWCTEASEQKEACRVIVGVRRPGSEPLRQRAHADGPMNWANLDQRVSRILS